MKTYDELVEDNAALVAHMLDIGEYMKDQWPGAYSKVFEKFGDLAPETSLARLKAKWQAEVLYEFTHGSYVMPATLNLAMCKRAEELRRKAEGNKT